MSPPGSGPRHAAFVTGDAATFLYVVHELSNTLVGYEVTYGANDTLSFRQVYNATTHGDANPLPAGTAAAEIVASVRVHPFLA